MRDYQRKKDIPHWVVTSPLGIDWKRLFRVVLQSIDYKDLLKSHISRGNNIKKLMELLIGNSNVSPALCKIQSSTIIRDDLRVRTKMQLLGCEFKTITHHIIKAEFFLSLKKITKYLPVQ